jgi:hypothetical protein
MFQFTDTMRNSIEVQEIPGEKVVFRTRGYNQQNRPATVVAIPIDKLDELLNFLFSIKYKGDAAGDTLPPISILEAGKDEMYFVVSNGDEPYHIYFNLKDAVRSGDRFIDVFDENGSLIKGYEKNEDGQYRFYEQSDDGVFDEKILNEGDLK